MIWLGLQQEGRARALLTGAACPAREWRDWTMSSGAARSPGAGRQSKIWLRPSIRKAMSLGQVIIATYSPGIQQSILYIPYSRSTYNTTSRQMLYSDAHALPTPFLLTPSLSPNPSIPIYSSSSSSSCIIAGCARAGGTPLRCAWTGCGCTSL